MAGVNELLSRGADAGIQSNGLGVGKGVVVSQPLRGARCVGQILLVQYFERRFAKGEFCQHRVGAGAWQARVQQFNDDVGLLDALLDGLFGQVHVTGEPLDGHIARSFFLRFRPTGDCHPAVPRAGSHPS